MGSVPLKVASPKHGEGEGQRQGASKQFGRRIGLGMIAVGGALGR